jgi:hypothetical protein
MHAAFAEEMVVYVMFVRAMPILIIVEIVWVAILV